MAATEHTQKRRRTDVTASVLNAAIPQILSSLPSEWRGTTFNNSNLLGRDKFSQNILDVVARRSAAGEKVTTSDLDEAGNAEDYLRVATNIATTLELALAVNKGLDASQVYTFGSTTMSIVAVCMVSKLPVHCYYGAGESPFDAAGMKILELMSRNLSCHAGAPPAKRSDGTTTVVLSSVAGNDWSAHDCVVDGHALYLFNLTKVPSSEVLVVRKRMATPVTTPMAEAMLQSLAGLPVTANTAKADPAAVAGFYKHLQEMSGAKEDNHHNPVIFTAGLPAICSLWVALIERGGADVLMCSTAYGGSSQLTDVVEGVTPTFHKHMFHIQGTAPIDESIDEALSKLEARGDSLMPTTVLFVEIPTNPDMKVPDLGRIVTSLRSYERSTGRKVLLLIDTTFAPASKILEKIQKADAAMPAMVFVSMSKSVSRGLTTAGGLVCNHTEESKTLLEGVRRASRTLDTNAKDDQMKVLSENHTGVEARCIKAYEVAKAAGDALCEAVKSATGESMHLAFVTPAHAEVGLTSSTFSFNLPAPKGATEAQKEAFAQLFVDHLTAHHEFKPCVSFGQDNGRVYATVPATSTQGAIRPEDKAKQAVGGVQLVRLSFPPTCDVARVSELLRAAVSKVY